MGAFGFLHSGPLLLGVLTLPLHRMNRVKTPLGGLAFSLIYALNMYFSELAGLSMHQTSPIYWFVMWSRAVGVRSAILAR